MKASLLHRIRHPIRLFVVFDNFISDLFHPNEPRWNSLVNKWRIRSPAEWVRMEKVILLYKTSALLQNGNEGFIGLFDMHALHGRNLLCEVTIGIHGTRKISPLDNNAMCQTDSVIVFSKGGGLVYDTGTGIICYIVIRKNLVVLVGTFILGEVIKDRNVLLPHKILSGESLKNLIEIRCHLWLPLLFAHLRIKLTQTGLCHNVSVSRIFIEEFHILQFFMHTQGNIGG
mmetsp:Transcript_23165/g.34351  ORF Transcript_23165/g.34351 Transcript_23165/m.34351 type:complete len:229 (-) Transcript_23165:187-873(-)